MQYNRDGYSFKWSGGAYIEVFTQGSSTPFEVYNVWNYLTDKPIIEYTASAFIQYVDESIEELIYFYRVST
jgi:hypothetical protein